MAYHFSANQFDDKYSPRKLGNWEYPKWYPDRPRQRQKTTKIIADDKGRLLDGIKRENAWGHYIGTWDLPKRITREYMAPPERLVKLWDKKKDPEEKTKAEEPCIEENQEEKNLEEGTCKICGRLYSDCTCEKVAQSKSSDSIEEEEKCAEPLTCAKCNNDICLCEDKCLCHFSSEYKYLSPAEKSFLKRNKSSSALDLHSPGKKFESNVVSKEEQDVDTKKSDSIEERIKNILESVEKPAKENTVKDICPEVKALSKHTREKTNSSPDRLVENGNNFKKSESLSNYLDDHINKYEEVRDEIDFEINHEKASCKSKEMNDTDQTQNENKDVPQDPMNYNNYTNVAKKFHDENLKHQPLPDVINDPMYKALISDRYPCPGGSLKVETMPTAIGWKNYSVPGPTECSKLKIFRPKTALDTKVKNVKEERPKTSKNYVPKKVLPIDLAICWDLKPDDSIKEPKKSLHIDGSNGCIAPAVFTMVHQQDDLKEQNFSGSCLPLAEKINQGIEENNVANLPSQESGKIQNSSKCPTNKEAIMSCVKASPKDSKNSDSPMSFTSVLTNVSSKTRENSKTLMSNEEANRMLTSKLMTLQREKEKKGSFFDPGKKYAFNNDFNYGSYNDKKINHSTPNLASKCSGSKCGTDKSSQDSFKINDFNKNKSLTNLSRGSDSKSDGKSIKNQRMNKDENKSRSSSGNAKPQLCSYNDNEKSEFKNTSKTETTKSDSPNSGSTLGLKSYKGSKNHLAPGKKKYSIGTLLPPFSYWPQNNSQNYPEHWRLVSVYQHSYKPINNRKRPLLASVFQ